MKTQSGVRDQLWERLEPWKWVPIAIAAGWFLWEWVTILVQVRGDFPLHWELGRRIISGAYIYAGKLTVSEARKAVKELGGKEPPYSPFLVWLGVVIVSIGFAVDIVGTWEGLLWAGIPGTVTGLVFVAADRIPGFGKVAQLVATLASGVMVMLAYKFGWTTALPGLLLIASTFVFIPGDSISTQSPSLIPRAWAVSGWICKDG